MPLNCPQEEPVYESGQHLQACPHPPDKLRNRYTAWRNAQSEANKANILVTAPENAITEYGLISAGYGEARAAAIQASHNEIINPDTIFITSDFLRAKQTAITAMHAINSKTTLVADPLLRDRNFGQYELQSTDHCTTISALDAIDPTHETGNVESIINVARRAIEAILKYEDAYSNQNIVLVSHDTPLRIIQTLFERRALSEYQQTPHFQNAEFRRLSP